MGEEALEAAMEWLRPFVNANPWEYVVVWKLGDDPSRFIQWGDCCCSGGDENGVVENVLVEEWCRDQFVKHPAKTRACKTLARLPFVIPLYSGIHGDVATSEQPVWTTSVSDNEGNETRVLIPVASGLIEFFSSKNVPKDQNIIDCVSARFGQDIVMDNLICKPQLSSYNYPENWPIHCLNFLPQMSGANNCSSFEGSSSCSSLSNEHQLHVAAKQNREQCDLQSINNLRLKRKKCADLGKEKPGVRNRQEKGPYKSKNLVTERNRRERIKAGMFALRSLVPKITKMDRASTLGDAAEYIEELHQIIEDYKHQLGAMDGDDRCSYIDAKPNIPRPTMDHADKKVNATTEVKVEVNQVGTNNFLLKLVCEHRRGGFSRLMEAVDALGLRVIDANVTALNGLVANVLSVEGNKEEVDDPKALEYVLIQLVN